MRIVVQRVQNAKVEVDQKIVGKIDKGLLLLVGFNNEDTTQKLDWMINKCVNMRIFDDSNGVMNLSVLDVGGSILSVSQFTLYGDAKKGNRPSYKESMNPTDAVKLFDIFNDKLSQKINVETGVFGGDMQVTLTNDGPVTIILEK
ncbi:D-aminoacyl-tRNA deacylase [Mycoplasmatota bacterium WC44]